jgi:hypothetical protein
MKRLQSWPAFALLLFGIGLVAFAEIAKAPPGTFKIPSPPLFTNSILPGANELPRLQTKNLDDIASLPPGVYLTKPYTCMVMKPGAMHDDSALKNLTVPTNSMPVLRPEMKAVPLGQAGR